MLKMIIVLLLLPTFAFGLEEISSDVFDREGNWMGEVFTDVSTWRDCTEEDELAGRCKPTDPVVCMTYENTCLEPIVCRLEVSAFMIEPYTGFTKRVTDVRTELVYYNSQHHVCFNFAKDIYHNWRLASTSDPLIDCVPYEFPDPEE